MLLLILSCLLGVAIIPVLVIIVKVMLSKQKLKFYHQQGMPTYFSGLKGHLLVEDKSLPENSKTSNLEYTKLLCKRSDCKAAGAIAMNFIFKSECLVNILSSDLVKEFLINENCFDRPEPFPDIPGVFGLFFHNTEKALRSKAMFLKLFRPEGLESFTPRFCKAIQEELVTFAKKHNIGNTSKTRISLQELLVPILLRVSSILLFGSEEVHSDKEILELPMMVHKIVANFMALYENPWTTVLPFKLAKALGLAPQVKTIEHCFSRQQQILQKYIDKRSKETDLGESIIDRSIAHNRDCLREGKLQDIISIEDLTGNYNLFYNAGTDTSLNVSKNVLCQMANLDSIKKYLDAINKQIYDSQGFTTTQAIECNAELSLWMKECLRTQPVLSRILPRTAMKNVKLGQYNIRKGDLVTLTFTALFKDEEFFKDTETFDLSRFSIENEKLLPRYQVIPFSVGKRNCPGRHVGELMVKLLVTKFIQFFEFEKPADVEYYRENILTTSVINPFVDVKLK